MEWTQQIAHWWVDYLAAATVLLAVVLIAGSVIRQPAQRMAMAWSATIALLVLAVCCAMPVWPRLALFADSHGAENRESVTRPGIEQEPHSGAMTVPEWMAATPEPKVGSLDAALRRPKSSKATEKSEGSNEGKVGSVDWIRLFSLSLLAGSLVVAAWLIFGQVRAWRLCRRATAASELARLELRSVVGSEAKLPRLLVSNLTSTAGAMGVWRPTILLPAEAVVAPTSLPAEPRSAARVSLRALLSHEWAHIERGDLWLLALGRVLLIALYAHPFYWSLRRRILADQELLADASAAAHCGRHNYAEALVAWARHLPRGDSKLSWALGMRERPDQLSRRIAMLLRLRMVCPRGWRVANWSVMVGLVLGLSLFTLNPTPVAKGETKADAPAVAAVKPATNGEANPQAVEIAGRCVDLKHKPVADAHVLIFRIDHSDKTRLVPHGRTKLAKVAVQGSSIKSQLAYNYSMGDPDKQRIIAEARTDATGRFRVPNLKADDAWLSQEDQVYVVIQAPGKGTIETMAIVQHVGKRLVAMVNPTMLTAASLRGRITNAEGKPVAGAIVYWAEINPLPKPVPGIYCAQTDADGRYDISDLYAEDLANDAPVQVTPFGAMQTESMVLSVEHPDYAPGVIEFTKIPSEHDLVLHRPATLRGHITDIDGKPAKKAYVSWTHESGLSDGTWTDDQGVYSLSRLVPGKYTIAAGREDRVTSSKEIALASGEERIDLQLRQGARLKARIVEDSPGTAQNAVRSTIYQLQATVDPHDPMKAITGSLQPDGSFSMTVEPGRNFIYLVNPDLKVVDAERLAKQGIELTAGQTVEIELRVVPRPGGFAAWTDEMNAAQAAEKGLPAPPPTKQAEQVANVGESAEERMMKEYMNWPSDMVPEKPMSEEAVMQWLNGLKGEVEYKTIDGEDCVTSITVGPGEPQFPEFDQLKTQIVWVEYSLLAHIEKFPHLENLVLIGASCDGKWLAPLRGHKNLETLILSWTQNLTPEGVQILATLPKLKTLALVGATVDDGVLREISRLPKIETLQVDGPFTDAGVEQLCENKKVTGLVLFGLGHGKITNETLRHVGSLPNLEGFQIGSMGGSMELSDDGLKYLANAKKLNELAVCGQGITDAGLVHLYGLKNLKELNVSQTMVTQKGVNELKIHLPELKVMSPVKNSVKVEAAKSSPTERQR